LLFFFFRPSFSFFYFPLLYIHGFATSTSPLPSEHASMGDASLTRADAHGVNYVGVHITVIAAPAPGTRLSIMALDTTRDDALLAAMAASPLSPMFLSVYTGQILPTASTKIKSSPPKRLSPSQLCREPLVATSHGPCGWGLKSQRKAVLVAAGPELPTKALTVASWHPWLASGGASQRGNRF
jgi:hypothetical protein